MCSSVVVWWLLLNPCCVEMCGILFVMYGSSVFSGVFAITERSEIDLYEPIFMSDMFEVSDVDFVGPCEVVVLACDHALLRLLMLCDKSCFDIHPSLKIITRTLVYG